MDVSQLFINQIAICLIFSRQQRNEQRKKLFAMNICTNAKTLNRNMKRLLPPPPLGKQFSCFALFLSLFVFRCVFLVANSLICTNLITSSKSFTAFLQ